VPKRWPDPGGTGPTGGLAWGPAGLQPRRDIRKTVIEAAQGICCSDGWLGLIGGQWPCSGVATDAVLELENRAGSPWYSHGKSTRAGPAAAVAERHFIQGFEPRRLPPIAPRAQMFARVPSRDLGCSTVNPTVAPPPPAADFLLAAAPTVSRSDHGSAHSCTGGGRCRPGGWALRGGSFGHAPAASAIRATAPAVTGTVGRTRWGLAATQSGGVDGRAVTRREARDAPRFRPIANGFYAAGLGPRRNDTRQSNGYSKREYGGISSVFSVRATLPMHVWTTKPAKRGGHHHHGQVLRGHGRLLRSPSERRAGMRQRVAPEGGHLESNITVAETVYTHGWWKNRGGR